MKSQATTDDRPRSRSVLYMATPVALALGAWILTASLVGIAAAFVGRLLGQG